MVKNIWLTIKAVISLITLIGGIYLFSSMDKYHFLSWLFLGFVFALTAAPWFTYHSFKALSLPWRIRPVLAAVGMSAMGIKALLETPADCKVSKLDDFCKINNWLFEIGGYGLLTLAYFIAVAIFIYFFLMER